MYQVNDTNYEVCYCEAFSIHISFGPNRLRILFSNTFNLLSSLNVRDYVSQPCRTTDNIIVLYILIFKFLDKLRRQMCLDLIVIICFKSAFYLLLKRILICQSYITILNPNNAVYFFKYWNLSILRTFILGAFSESTFFPRYPMSNSSTSTQYKV